MRDCFPVVVTGPSLLQIASLILPRKEVDHSKVDGILLVYRPLELPLWMIGSWITLRILKCLLWIGPCTDILGPKENILKGPFFFFKPRVAGV